MQPGMSASQLGLNQPRRELNVKGPLLKIIAGLVVIGGAFAVLVFTNIIALSEFKTVNYTNSAGGHYSFQFYAKHSNKTLSSGNTELVSKVSEDGKFPITMSIAQGPVSSMDKNGVKGCTGPLPKVFDVQNSNLKQKISVCYFPVANGGPVGVYIAAFSANDKANIVTISQDLSGTDLSSQSGAQKSLSKFGIDPYQDDIKKIVASIKVN